jgi:hypothetical protein
LLNPQSIVEGAKAGAGVGIGVNGTFKAGWDASMARTQAALGEENLRYQAMHDGFQGQAGVNQFGFSQQGRGLEAASGRNSAAADFSGRSAQYDAERNMATSLGGELAAMGAGGALSIGSKPVGMEPMAMTGQLGRGMQERAQFAENGFQKFVNSGQQKLQGMYGYDAMMSHFKPGDGRALLDRVNSGANYGPADPSDLSRGRAGSQNRFNPNGTMKDSELGGAIPNRHPNLGVIGMPSK